MDSGAHFTSTLPTDRLAMLIVEEAQKQHHRIERWTDADRGTVIRTIQTACWWRILANHTPQDVLWTIQPEERQVRLICNVRLFHWYACVILLCCGCAAVTPAALAQLLITARSNPLAAAVRLPIIVAAFLALLSAANRLLRAKHTEPLIERLRVRVEQYGHFLEPDRPASQTHYFLLLAYIWILAIAVIYACEKSTDQSFLGAASPWLILIMAGLLAVIGGLCLVLIIGAGHSAFSQRAHPLLPGFSTLAALGWLLVPHVAWIFAPVPALIAAVTPLSFAVTGALAANGVSVTLRTLPGILRLQTHAQRLPQRGAAAGAGFLRRFQGVFGAILVLAGALVLAGVASLMLAAARAMWVEALGLNVPEERIRAAGGREMYELYARSSKTPYIVWAGYAISVATVFCVSLGSLFLTRRRALRELKSHSICRGSRSAWADDLLKQIAARAGVHGINLAVFDSAVPEANSYRFGLFRPRRFVALSSWCVENLTREQLEALLAHEVAHHLRGHCLKDNLLRLLGRVTCVGDAFVRALEDSFGYELEADRAAVARLGVNPKVLRCCLVRMHEVAAAEGVVGLPRDSALGAIAQLPAEREQLLEQLLKDGFDSLTRKQRWRLAWHLFVSQYTSAMNVAYWHPSEEERKLVLADMMRRAATGQGDVAADSNEPPSRFRKPAARSD